MKGVARARAERFTGAIDMDGCSLAACADQPRGTLRRPVVLGAVAAVAILAILTPAARADTSCAGTPATIVGTSGSDTINGTEGADVISGLAGNDTINGLGDADIICG